MDGKIFDLLTKRLGGRLSTRRGLLRLGLGGGVAIIAFGQITEEALACRRNGRRCVRNKKQGNCCSGTCKKGICRPTPGARGCRVNQDFCQGEIFSCPRNPDGLCVLLDNGKPFCAERQDCAPCTSNADCTRFPNGRCVTTCSICGETSGHGCIYPKDTGQVGT